MKGVNMADKMLIDGLIKFCYEKSKNIKLKAEPQVFVEIKQALEEVKYLKLKEHNYDNCRNFTCKHKSREVGFNIGYARAIDEFAEELLKVSEGNIDMYVWCSDIKRIAEQMKAGGIDG
jgi:hypothetical protein